MVIQASYHFLLFGMYHCLVFSTVSQCFPQVLRFSGGATTVASTASTTAKQNNTTTVKASRCMSSEFECRVKSSCIPTGWKCDGTADCDDGTDEDDCGRVFYTHRESFPKVCPLKSLCNPFESNLKKKDVFPSENYDDDRL